MSPHGPASFPAAAARVSRALPAIPRGRGRRPTPTRCAVEPPLWRWVQEAPNVPWPYPFIADGILFVSEPPDVLLSTPFFLAAFSFVAISSPPLTHRHPPSHLPAPPPGAPKRKRAASEADGPPAQARRIGAPGHRCLPIPRPSGSNRALHRGALRAYVNPRTHYFFEPLCVRYNHLRCGHPTSRSPLNAQTFTLGGNVQTRVAPKSRWPDKLSSPNHLPPTFAPGAL